MAKTTCFSGSFYAVVLELSALAALERLAGRLAALYLATKNYFDRPKVTVTHTLLTLHKLFTFERYTESLDCNGRM